MPESYFRCVPARVMRRSSDVPLLNRGFDPNTRDEQGQTGLLIAMREPSPKVIQVLLDSPKTNVELRNAKDESPLMLAAIGVMAGGLAGPGRLARLRIWRPPAGLGPLLALALAPAAMVLLLFLAGLLRSYP